MYLDEIALKNYRNYESCRIGGFSRGVNIFIGGNAQGKTNFLEAVNYVSWGRSMRGSLDKEAVTYGKRLAAVDARFFSGDFMRHIEEEFDTEGKKQIKIDGESIKRISLLVGIANTIVFSPDDLRTVKDSPSIRRKTIDQEISKVRPVYYRDLTTYMSAVREKNRLLKMKGTDVRLIESYNEQLVEYGTKIIDRRGGFIDMLAKTASHVHQQLASGEKLEIAYRCCCDRGDIKNSLTKKLEKNMDRELETGVSMTGPHREDVDIRIGGMSAKSYASQGQQRTAILSIKIACAMLAKKATGDAPVLLLDDVFSELDEKRRNNLVRMTEGFQVFITGTELPGGFKAPEMKLFTVEKGKIESVLF